MEITARAWKAAAKKWRARAAELAEELDEVKHSEDEMNLYTSRAWERQVRRIADLNAEASRLDEQLRQAEIDRWQAQEKAGRLEEKAKRIERYGGW